MIGKLQEFFGTKQEVIEPEVVTPVPDTYMQQHYPGLGEARLPSSLCQHQWQEKVRSVAPRRRELPQFQTPPEPEVLEKALLGVLTIIYECTSCKELYKTELLGSDKTELDDILDNVEKTGGQYYSRGNITFVIQRHIPQQQPVTLR